jgi:hypothetical protein
MTMRLIAELQDVERRMRELVEVYCEAGGNPGTEPC